MRTFLCRLAGSTRPSTRRASGRAIIFNAFGSANAARICRVGLRSTGGKLTRARFSQICEIFNTNSFHTTGFSGDGRERRVGNFEPPVGARAGGAALPLESMADGSASASGLDFGGGTLDDFTVEKAIGRGHFSVVHRAVRNSDAKRVALKKVSIFDTMDAKARERCIKEVKLLQTLPPHPCIIRFEGAFIDSNELYIVFEWAEHGDLRRLLKRAQVMALPQPQPLPLPLPQPQPLVRLSLRPSLCLSPPLLAPRRRRRTPRCRSRRSGGTLCRSATRSGTCTTRASCTATSSR